MDSAPKNPLGRVRAWVNPVTADRQKKRLAKRKLNRKNRKSSK